MCSLFELIYTTLLRGIVKYFLHWYYGTSELERYAEARDLPNFLWSLSMSSDESLKLLHARLTNDPQLMTEDLFLTVADVKESETPDRFKSNLSEMYNVYERVLRMKLDAIAAAKVPTDDNNPEHIGMTDMIWRSLRPYDDTPYYERDWVLLGFQGRNPFTDFRGSGMLGLLNLLSISQTALGHELYTLSQDRQNFFFYAVTSIKVSFMLIKCFYSDSIDNVLYRTNGRLQFQRLFDKVFEDLSKRWVNAKLGIMEFESFAAEYQREFPENLLKLEL
mmetsp:Transcript_13188/g.24686  ORF Transcript_13188/g.24686 Transcript_13188/m.24686 type:complete len:277 (-) Transcript_13188:918-1748(-)